MKYRLAWGLLVCLLSSLPALAQQIPSKGTEGTFEVATWNIEWFGASNGPSDNARQRANVRDVIEQADIDLWAVQEISDPQDFEMLLAELGTAYDGILATESGQQRIGFIYKTSVIRNVVAQHILTEFAQGTNNAFAGRPPLQMTADVVLFDRTTVRVTFITVHMKCCGSQSDYDRRVEAATRLKNRIDFTSLAGDPLIILGDFNDELGDSIASGRTTPYQNFLNDTAGYSFLTLPLDQQNLPTYCGSSTACSFGSTLDHILITNELFSAYQPGSADRFIELVDAFDGTGGACGGEYTCTTSDHLPVFARFVFSTHLAFEAETALQEVIIEPAYPNPSRDHTTLAYTLAHAGDVRVEVFDLLGRRIAMPVASFQPVGAHQIRLDTESWLPGVYLVRFTTGTFVQIRHFVRVR